MRNLTEEELDVMSIFAHIGIEAIPNIELFPDALFLMRSRAVMNKITPRLLESVDTYAMTRLSHIIIGSLNDHISKMPEANKNRQLMEALVDSLIQRLEHVK